MFGSGEKICKIIETFLFLSLFSFFFGWVLGFLDEIMRDKEDIDRTQQSELPEPQMIKGSSPCHKGHCRCLKSSKGMFQSWSPNQFAIIIK